MNVMMNQSSIDSTMLVEDTRGEMTNDVYAIANITIAKEVLLSLLISWT